MVSRSVRAVAMPARVVGRRGGGVIRPRSLSLFCNFAYVYILYAYIHANAWTNIGSTSPPPFTKRKSVAYTTKWWRPLLLPGLEKLFMSWVFHKTRRAHWSCGHLVIGMIMLTVFVMPSFWEGNRKPVNNGETNFRTTPSLTCRLSGIDYLQY